MSQVNTHGTSQALGLCFWLHAWSLTRKQPFLGCLRPQFNDVQPWSSYLMATQFPKMMVNIDRQKRDRYTLQGLKVLLDMKTKGTQIGPTPIKCWRQGGVLKIGSRHILL